MRDTEKALRWITSILKESNIPFQILGGFAAHIYGSHREIVDIDIAIPENKFLVILPKIKEYVTFGPERYLDKDWDLQLITLSYCGQELDLAGAHEMKIFNHTKQEWVRLPMDFSASEYKEIYGIKVPLIKKERLVEYKKMIAREVDIEDVKVLENKE